MPSCRSASPSSGACPPRLGPEPLLYTLIRDHPAHFWDKQVLPEGASAPKGDSGQEQLLRPLPCLPPHCLISSLVMFQAPGETGRNPESPPQKWQTAAPPWSRLLPSATLQLRAAFSLSLRLPPAERLAFRRRMEKRRGSHLLSSLGADAQSQSRGTCPGQPRPHWRLGQGPGHTEATGLPGRTPYWALVLPRGPHPATATSAVSEFPVAQRLCVWTDGAGRAVGRGGERLELFRACCLF